MKNKDLKECLAVFKALRSDNNLKPDQKVQVDIIISRVKKLGRGQKLQEFERTYRVLGVSQ